MYILTVFLSLLMLFQPSEPTRVRFLLRDETDAGVAGAALTLRTETGDILTVVTDANGVAVTGAMPGTKFWLVGGQRSNGVALVADSVRAEGFPLGLIPGQVRDALLRLDGDLLVLDPDMIFSPNEPGEPPVPTPWQFAATVVPLTDQTPLAGTATPDVPAATMEAGAGSGAGAPTDTALASGIPTPETPVIAANASVPASEAAASRTAITILVSVALLGMVLVALALLFAFYRRRHI